MYVAKAFHKDRMPEFRHNFIETHGIERRVFVVGCPRSGTTLIQAMLAGHGAMTSFPETNFFHFACRSSRRGFFSRLSKRRCFEKALFETLRRLDRSDLGGMVPRSVRGFKEYADAYRRVLDRIAIERGVRNWLEKTPEHLHYLDLIAETIPDARFIHIVRNGSNVVASLARSVAEGPREWNWPVGDLDHYIKRWNFDVEITLKAQANSRHHVVFYESLLGRPEEELRRVCDFLDLEFEQRMLDPRNSAELVLGAAKREPWRRGVFDPLRTETARVSEAQFPPEQQAFEQSGLLCGGDWRKLFGVES